MDLSLQQQFELERQLRVIEDEKDMEKLRDLCRMLAQAWHAQKAATMHFMREAFNAPPSQIDLRGALGSSPAGDRDPGSL